MTILTMPSRSPRGRSAQSRPTNHRAPISRPAKGLWWVSPAGSLLLVVPLSLFVAIRIPDSDYRLFYKTPRVIGVSQAELFLVSAAALAIGTLIPMALNPVRPRLDWPTLPGNRLTVLRKAEAWAFRLTMLGYIALGLIGVKRGARPSLLIGAITSQDNYSGSLKRIFAPVAGVTSLTQVGIAYVVVAGVLLCHGRSAKLIRRIGIVLLLGLMRSYLLTERLALLELIVPLVAIGAGWLRQRPRRGAWLPLLPVLALPLLVVIFGAFEYSRSWVYFRSRTTQSFPVFVINRLAGYYATSYNNGALQLAQPKPLGRLPYDSIQALWTAPGIAQLHLYTRLTHQQGIDLLDNALLQHGNPEFNNPGGLAVPTVDFGRIGGPIFFLIAGVFIGFAYRSWRSGQPTGLLVYPVLFTGLLELPRYLYWTQGRVFPPLVFLLVTAALMTRSTRPRLRRRPARASVK